MTNDTSEFNTVAERDLQEESAEAKNLRKSLADANNELNALRFQTQVDDLTGKYTDWRATRSDLRTLLQHELEISADGKLRSKVQGLTPSEVVDRLATEHGYLRGHAAKGGGELCDGRYSIAECFGAKSIGKRASALMKESPSEYRRGRKLAIDRGLL